MPVPHSVPAGGAEGHQGRLHACVSVCLSAPSTAYQEALAVCSWLGEISLAPKGWTYSHGFTLNLVTLWQPCPVPAFHHCHSLNHTCMYARTHALLSPSLCILLNIFPSPFTMTSFSSVHCCNLHKLSPHGQCYKLLQLLQH